MGAVTSPPGDESPRQRLARLMDERRGMLRKTWDAVADDAGLTKEGLRGVRFGEGAMRRLTKSGIEDALRWLPGSIDAVLAGGDPAPLSAPEPRGEREGEDEFERLDRLYEEWKRDPERGPVLKGILESWGDRDTA